MDKSILEAKIKSGELTRGATCFICKKPIEACKDVRKPTACSRPCEKAMRYTGRYMRRETCTYCEGTGVNESDQKQCNRCDGKGGWNAGSISAALGQKLLKLYGGPRGVEREEAIKALQARDESNARKLQAQRADKYQSNRYREIGGGKSRQA